MPIDAAGTQDDGGTAPPRDHAPAPPAPPAAPRRSPDITGTGATGHAVRLLDHLWLGMEAPRLRRRGARGPLP